MDRSMIFLTDTIADKMVYSISENVFFGEDFKCYNYMVPMRQMKSSLSVMKDVIQNGHCVTEWYCLKKMLEEQNKYATVRCQTSKKGNKAQCYAIALSSIKKGVVHLADLITKSVREEYCCANFVMVSVAIPNYVSIAEAFARLIPNIYYEMPSGNHKTVYAIYALDRPYRHNECVEIYTIIRDSLGLPLKAFNKTIANQTHFIPATMRTVHIGTPFYYHLERVFEEPLF